MRDDLVDAVVVGAGISGLACAHALHRSGRSVRVIESSGHIGGVIESIGENGFLVEAGPNSTLENNAELTELIESTTASAERVTASARARKRYILRGGTLHALPMSPPALIGTKLFSAGAKLRLFAEPFVSRGTSDDEAVYSFFRRRFGREIADYAVDPFVSGVYAGDPGRLGVRSAFPSLAAFESRSGSVFKGAIASARARNRDGGKRRRSVMISFSGGMESLPAAIARELGDAIATNAQCVKLERAEVSGAWRVHVRDAAGDESLLECDSVVVSAPAATAADLIAPFDEDCAAELRAIEYAPVASVFLGYDESAVAHPLDGFGFLVPSGEGRDILGTIFSSTLFDGRAPAGSVALTTFVGGVKHPDLVDLEDGDMIALVTAELDRLIGTRGDPSFVRIHRWKRAIPQYNRGHYAIVDALRDVEGRLDGLHFSASFAGGISVADCVRTATNTAGAIGERLAAGA